MPHLVDTVLGTALAEEMSDVRRPSASQRNLEPFDNTQEIDLSANTGPSGSSNGHELDETRVINSTGALAVPSRTPVAGGSQGNSGRGGGKQHVTKTRTVADLRAARESRANEALKMKDEQLRILQHQNNQLLGNLDR